MEPEQQRRHGADRRFLAQLPEEVQSWQEQSIITPEQGRAIIDSYGVAEAGDVLGPQSRLVSILAVLGAVLVGLGVILFFASNWSEIPRPAKLAMLLVVLAATYGAGYWLRYVRDYRRVGTAIIFLGALFYGAAIHLVAQAYHIPVNDPNLFLFWFLGALPLAYVTGSQSILVLGLLLFLGAVGFRLPGWLPDLELTPFAAFPMYLSLGIFLYGAGGIQERFRETRDYANSYKMLGLLTTLGSLYMLTWRFWWEELGSAGGAAGITGISAGLWVSLALATALGIGALLAVALLETRNHLRRRMRAGEAIVAMLLLAAVYLALFLPVTNDVAYPLLFNLLLFLAILGVILTGYFQGREVLINIGLAFFIVDVLSRYFELGWRLVDRSVVFIVAGVILLVGGFLLERARRAVIGRMRIQEANVEPET